MSLVGSVSLTNNQNGLYLGKVNLNNFDASSNSIIFSSDGVTLKGNSYLNYDESTNTLILNNNPNGNNAHLSLNGDTGGVNMALASNGEQGLKWTSLIDTGFRVCYVDLGQHQTTTSSQNLSIYDTNGDKWNYRPNLQDYVNCMFNLTFSANEILVTGLGGNRVGGWQELQVYSWTESWYSDNITIFKPNKTHTHTHTHAHTPNNDVLHR